MVFLGFEIWRAKSNQSDALRDVYAVTLGVA